MRESRKARKAKTNGSTGHRYVRYFGIASIVFALGIISMVALQVMNKNQRETTKFSEEQYSMARYLEKKYGRKFNVSNYRIEGSGLGVEGIPVADAQPIDDSDIKFKVSDRGKGKNIFADTYAQEYWSKQGKEELDREIRSIMPNIRSVGFSVTGDLAQNFHTMENYPFKGSIPDVRKVLKDYPGKLKVSFGVHSDIESMENEPSIAQLKNAYDVIAFARDTGISNGSVGYTYTHPNYSETNAHGDKIPRYNIVVNAEELNDIRQPEQLKQFFTDQGKEGK